MTTTTLTAEQMARYDRQIMLKEIGTEGQMRLLNSKVLVIGAGGLGSPAAFYLAAAGVGTIGIADGDVVEISNLQRQILHAASDLGRPKAVSARESLTALNPGIRVNEIAQFATAESLPEIIRPYDFILSCTDTLESKMLISDACVSAGKPFCHGGILGFEGQALTYVPGRGPGLRQAFGGGTVSSPPAAAAPTPPGGSGSEEKEHGAGEKSCRVPPVKKGVLGCVAGVIGAIQAAEAIKYLTGAGQLLTGKLLIFDALTMEFRTIRLSF